MTIDDIIAIAQRVHDAERMHFGASSTRQQRNEHWARIIGIVHHGHPAYNPTPDARWCLKDPDGDGARPQSDDVVVFAPTREFWDCIPGAGADGYRFQATYEGPLPMEQFVYAPPRPADSGVVLPPPTPEPPPPAACGFQPSPDVRPDLQALQSRIDILTATVDTLTASNEALRGVVADLVVAVGNLKGPGDITFPVYKSSGFVKVVLHPQP